MRTRTAFILRCALVLSTAMAVGQFASAGEDKALKGELERSLLDDPVAHYSLANALYQKHDLDGAITEYRKAIRLKPEFAEAHYNLGTDGGRSSRNAAGSCRWFPKGGAQPSQAAAEV